MKIFMIVGRPYELVQVDDGTFDVSACEQCAFDDSLLCFSAEADPCMDITNGVFKEVMQ